MAQATRLPHSAGTTSDVASSMIVGVCMRIR